MCSLNKTSCQYNLCRTASVICKAADKDLKTWSSSQDLLDVGAVHICIKQASILSQQAYPSLETKDCLSVGNKSLCKQSEENLSCLQNDATPAIGLLD